MRFYIQSTTLQISGKFAPCYLCEDLTTGKKLFRQSFEMNCQWWKELEFQTDKEALTEVREWFAEQGNTNQFYLSDDSDSVMVLSDDTIFESSVRIKRGVS